MAQTDLLKGAAQTMAKDDVLRAEEAMLSPPSSVRAGLVEALCSNSTDSVRTQRGCGCGVRHAALLTAALLSTLSACTPAPEPVVPVPITGLDHLADHLSIQQFSVNGQGGAQAGKGGSHVCCVNLPAKWRPGLTVNVAWGVTNWPAKVYSLHERDVAVDKYDEVGNLYIHFLRDGSVKALSSLYHPMGENYPGPAYSTVPRKEPWEIYFRKPGEPEFPEVKDATEVPSK